jgi:tRNA G18 (ribose-2'-O)-methylase SpoU
MNRGGRIHIPLLSPGIHLGSRGVPLFILDGFRSAYNVGSAFRTAEAASPSALLLCGCCAVPPNRKLAHTARGTQREVPWRRFDDALEAACWARGTGRRLVAVDNSPDAECLFEARFETGDAFVFGNEALGIDGRVLGTADVRVCFPQTGLRGCLNVAGVLAIVAAEIQRRRLACGSLPGAQRRVAGMEGPGE